MTSNTDWIQKKDCFCSDMLVPAESILAGLTDKQVEMLCESFSSGYFDQPAKVTADELAKRAGVSKSTFTEHLRKAEGKVLTNVFPILRLACKRDVTGKECGKGEKD
jgi:predicted DNA binding protein